MRLELMPEPIQRAVKSVLRENNVTASDSFVSVEAVIQELDDMSYWDQPLGYGEKYKRIEKYLFTEDELIETPIDVAPEAKALLSDKLKNVKAISMGETINKLDKTRVFPDVIDDKYSN